MKKRFLIVFALLSLCFALTAPVSADVAPVDPDTIPTDPGIEAISADIEPISEDITDGMFTDEFLIWDDAMLLTDSEWHELNYMAVDITARYQCEVRILTIENMSLYPEYSSDAYEFAKQVYRDYFFGYGEELSGIMLMLSTEDRDFALIAYGFGNVAFTDHGKSVMLNNYILPFLGDDKYYDAFLAYLNKSEEYLAMARAGTPFDIDTDGSAGGTFAARLALNIVIPVVVALIVCLVFRAQMKTARKQRAAANYVPEGGFVLTGSSDTYLYSTETRVTKSDSSSGGGTSVDSGGFSGSSGKY